MYLGSVMHDYQSECIVILIGLILKNYTGDCTVTDWVMCSCSVFKFIAQNLRHWTFFTRVVLVCQSLNHCLWNNITLHGGDWVPDPNISTIWILINLSISICFRIVFSFSVFGWSDLMQWMLKSPTLRSLPGKSQLWFGKSAHSWKKIYKSIPLLVYV